MSAAPCPSVNRCNEERRALEWVTRRKNKVASQRSKGLNSGARCDEWSALWEAERALEIKLADSREFIAAKCAPWFEVQR